MSILSEKAAQRAHFKRVRACIPTRQTQEAALTEALLALPQFEAASQVFCYVSFGSEPDTHAFLNACFAMGKPVAVPKIEEKSVMRFYTVRSLDELSPVPPYGIPEPTASPLAAADDTTLCVVPALAFDKAGHRLGYGGGYYDRFLCTFPGVRLGVCFTQCVALHLPHTAHDVIVNALLTPQGLTTFDT